MAVVILANIAPAGRATSDRALDSYGADPLTTCKRSGWLGCSQVGTNSAIEIGWRGVGASFRYKEMNKKLIASTGKAGNSLEGKRVETCGDLLLFWSVGNC